MSDTNTINDAVETEVTFEKGSWQETLHKSSVLLDRSTAGRKKASSLLWQGAMIGIEGWDQSTDANGEGLYNEVLTALGKSRKGDASKIRTVALAVANNGLVLASFPNLSKAYAEAVRLTKTVAQNQDEDDAAEAAIEAIAADAPKTASTAESAAALLLAKGVDGAVVALLDALGANNEAAHRSFMRAVSTEISARVTHRANAEKAKKDAERAAAKAEQAEKGEAKPATAKATVKPAAEKAKAKPKPKSASKGDPNAKALPPKAATEGVAEAVTTKAKPVAVQPKGKPVVARR